MYLQEKCEQDLDNKAQLRKLLKKFSDKNDSKFNISLNTGLKIQNHFQEIPLIKGFQGLDFLKMFSFDFAKFSSIKLFNIQ
jgi:hypothetical protein